MLPEGLLESISLGSLVPFAREFIVFHKHLFVSLKKLRRELDVLFSLLREGLEHFVLAAQIHCL